MKITAKQLMLLCALKGRPIVATNTENFIWWSPNVDLSTTKVLPQDQEEPDEILGDPHLEKPKERTFEFHMFEEGGFDLYEVETNRCWCAPQINSPDYNYPGNFEILNEPLSPKEVYLLDHFAK